MPKPPPHETQKARLEAYQQAGYNFDVDRLPEYSAATGWQVDDYETELPAEAPGPPAAQGSWAAAREVLRNYTFPPPGLITGIFLPDEPLERRVMVLRGRFLLFTFWFGVRVGSILDEQRTLPDGGQEQVWGYNYGTLEGHFERGQIDFTVHKNLATGRVVFRIHAVSQTGRIRNPFYWLSFRLFGRMLQRRFSRQSLKRLKAQVAQMLRKGWTVPDPAEAPPVQAAANNAAAQQQLNKSN
jgi:hypothetical protein